MSKTGFKYNIGDVVFYIKDVPCAGIITDRRAADYDEDYVIEKYYTLNNDINLYENDLYKTKQDAMLEQVKQSKHNFADDFDSVIKKIQARNKTIYNFLFNDYDSETIVITIPETMLPVVDDYTPQKFNVAYKEFNRLYIKKIEGNLPFYDVAFVLSDDIYLSKLVRVGDIYTPYPIDLTINELLEEHIIKRTTSE